MKLVHKVHHSKHYARSWSAPSSNRRSEAICLPHVSHNFSTDRAVVSYLVMSAYLHPLQFIINQSSHNSMPHNVSSWKAFVHVAYAH